MISQIIGRKNHWWWGGVWLLGVFCTVLRENEKLLAEKFS